MTHEETIAEVEGAKSATTIASSDDASSAAPIHGGSLHGDAGGGGGSHAPAHAPGEAAVRAPESGRSPESGRAEGELRVIAGGAVEASGAGKPASSTETEDDEEDVAASGKDRPAGGGSTQSKSKKHTNNLRKLRIERMMSKAELARRANLSVLTIDRIEKGFGCRMDSKRKILEALGLSLADRVRVFGEEE
jgi:DNA-binding XRE family transcriptional regulator